MNVIIVSDVFGVTPALESISKKLRAKAIVDPYQGVDMNFKDEAQAYSCFLETIGLDGYLTKLIKSLKLVEKEIVARKLVNKNIAIVGFSVGAATIWRLSQNYEGRFIKQAFCFYGSQIRKYTQISPCFQINLIFPKQEDHFDVNKLYVELQNRVNVNIQQVDYLHGFMNAHSTNFHQAGYQEHLGLLCSKITEQ